MRRTTSAVLLVAVALLTSLAWTTESQAQARIARVGIFTFFSATTNSEQGRELEHFRRPLAEQGWIEGQNIAFEYRSADGDLSRLGGAVEELIRLKVDVILAVSAPCVRAAHAAIRTIPIVATDYTTDPVAEGYVESYGRPGGNLTGVFLDAPEFAGKWLQILKAIVPDLSRAAVLWDPSPGPAHLKAVQSLAQSLRIQIQVIKIGKPDDLGATFSALRGKPQAVILLPSPMMYTQSERLAELTLKHRLLATSMARQFADAGGTIAYGPEQNSTYGRAAVLVAKILRGAKPGDLPVERPTKVQLVVNLKTAKVLGLTVPETVLYRADEVIR